MGRPGVVLLPARGIQINGRGNKAGSRSFGYADSQEVFHVFPGKVIVGLGVTLMMAMTVATAQAAARFIECRGCSYQAMYSTVVNRGAGTYTIWNPFNADIYQFRVTCGAHPNASLPGNPDGSVTAAGCFADEQAVPTSKDRRGTIRGNWFPTPTFPTMRDRGRIPGAGKAVATGWCGRSNCSGLSFRKGIRAAISFAAIGKPAAPTLWYAG